MEREGKLAEFLYVDYFAPLYSDIFATPFLES
jgi:hypothetical protein